MLIIVRLYRSKSIFYVHHLTINAYRVAQSFNDSGQNPNDVHAIATIVNKS